jgi:hypothetical protein
VENASIPFEERTCWYLHPSILNPLHNILGTHEVRHTSSCKTIYNYFYKHGFFHSRVPWNVCTSLPHRKSLEDMLLGILFVTNSSFHLLRDVAHQTERLYMK